MSEEISISVVIPTRNRAYILRETLPSILSQSHVKEVIVIDDASEDETKELIEALEKQFLSCRFTYKRNETRKGAPYGRNLGIALAKHPLLLFCDDDVFLEENYTEVLVEKLQADSQIAIASGRLVQMEPKEEYKSALKRFGNGDPSCKKVFCPLTFSFIQQAFFTGDVYLPLTHSCSLAYTDLLRKYPYDEHYSKGNGFREESDIQVQLFLEGYKILMTNDTHAMHKHPKDVAKGGQRTSHLKRIYYSIYYTNYFYKKYFSSLKKPLNLSYSRKTAIFLYTVLLFKEYFNALILNKCKIFLDGNISKTMQSGEFSQEVLSNLQPSKQPLFVDRGEEAEMAKMNFQSEEKI